MKLKSREIYSGTWPWSAATLTCQPQKRHACTLAATPSIPLTEAHSSPARAQLLSSYWLCSGLASLFSMQSLARALRPQRLEFHRHPPQARKGSEMCAKDTATLPITTLKLVVSPTIQKPNVTPNNRARSHILHPEHLNQPLNMNIDTNMHVYMNEL